MLDKNHTQLVSTAYTRRGNYDEEATLEMQEELEPFYDFSSSMLEYAQRITDPAQKAASILRFFDTDKDQVLSRAEVAALWAATNDGAELSEAQYEGACKMAGAKPKDGLDAEDLNKLYEGGFADVNEHFKVLQDLLVKKTKKAHEDMKNDLKTVKEEDEDEDSDEEDGESEEDNDHDVLECEDEDEFQEVMRVLGLQPVSLTETGDLRLPNGNIAVNRDVSYIYKQRGARADAITLAGHSSRPDRHRSQLMLGNSPNANGSMKIAMTKRQEARDKRMIIAVLRKQSTEYMRLGEKHNTALQKNKARIATGRGDCSNGR